MKIIDKLIFLLISRTAKNAMLSVLSERIPRNILFELNAKVWKNYGTRVVGLKYQPTFGADVMTRLSLLTLMIFEQLCSHGYSDQDAIQATSGMLWIIYERLTMPFWVCTRIFSKTPIKRVGKAMDFFIKHFPYGSPGYEMEILNADHIEYAFNVYKCPAAEFFKKHNRSDLCIASWCNLDFPLADKWEVILDREKTIANGNQFCNFKFLSKKSAPNRANPADAKKQRG
jgi:hypothetical protein